MACQPIGCVKKGEETMIKFVSSAGLGSLGAALVFLTLAAAASTRAADPASPVAAMTAEQDHQNMMDQLHITALRPGADGFNAQAPNAQNTDESKATRYTNLPDPLVLKNGKKVTTPKMWWTQRRPQIVEDFDREVYGRIPKTTPKVTWEVVKTTPETNGGVPIVTKQLVGHVDNSADPAITVNIQLTLSTPANARGPVPVMMEFGFPPFPGGGRGGFPGFRALFSMTGRSAAAPRLPSAPTLLPGNAALP